MSIRTVRRLLPAIRDDIADLITRRPLPAPGLDQLDPFLFLNHHGPQTYPPGNSGLPFGPHPHRGFETVTFILDGELAHRDSAGHESIIGAGGVQWMTAGSGIVHEEVSPRDFRRRGGRLEILQLWVNLPSRLKMTPPRYIGLQSEDLATFSEDDGRVTGTLISGAWSGLVGPVHSMTDVQMATLQFAPDGVLRVSAARERTVLLYVIRGELSVSGTMVSPYHLVEMNADGDEIDLRATTEAFILLGHGMPFNEPVAWHGPFVMNTREEIIAAIRDYQAGRLGGSLS